MQITTSISLNNNAGASGTSFHGVTIKVDPKKLIAFLGNCRSSDGYKVSKCWNFTGPNGEVITLYDWKETSLYGSGYPSPDEFWSSNRVELHLGHFREHMSLASELQRFLQNKFGV